MNLNEVEASVLAEMDKERGRRRMAQVAAAAATVLGSGIVLFTAHQESGPRELTAAVLLVCTALLFARASGWVIAIALAGSAALTYLPPLGPNLQSGLGMHCMATEVAVTLIPLLSVWLAARINRDPMRPLRLAQVAMLAAVAAQGVLALVCPAHQQTLHLIVFHNGGVIAAGLLAWIMGRATKSAALG